LEEAKKVALERGGLCLSTEYVNSSTNMLWQCKEGHEWSAWFANVKYNKSWCPYCTCKTESECRAIFEKLTGKKWVKIRPPWLGGLELDGYCKELGIAWEYNGEQHYEVIPMWHKNGEADLKAQQERDKRKFDLCFQNDVALIVIPYTEKNNLEEIIRMELNYLI
jgi:hypothetical protein